MRVSNKLLKQAFDALYKVGGREQAEQFLYASNVQDLLNMPDSENEEVQVSCLQAETGIGKTLGYSIPALLYLHENKSKRIFVSTFTRSLQRQLLHSDLKLIKKVFSEMKIELPKTAFRMGKQAFFSTGRTQKVVNELDPKGEDKELQEFLRLVKHDCAFGSGLWLDYLESYGEFPKGIIKEDVCMLDKGESDNDGYDKHIELAKDARFLITNHATILNRYALAGSQADLLIVDEAHEMPKVCEGLANRRLQFKRLNKYLQDTKSPSKELAETATLCTSIQQALAGFDEKNTTDVVLESKHADIFTSITPKLSKLHKLSEKIKIAYEKECKNALLSQKEADIQQNLEDVISTLECFLEDNVDFRQRALMFSKVRRDSSLASVLNNPGILFRLQAKGLTNKILLTSATIANANSQLSFSNICYELALRQDSLVQEASFSPSNYGCMNFTVCHPDTPKPVDKVTENVQFNKKWLNNTKCMIEKATENGTTLVLAMSFKEVKELSKLIDNDDIIFHTEGGLNEALVDFTNGRKKCLVTPSAWEGVSLRGSDGGQLLKNLVITRIPFCPLSAEGQKITIDYLIKQGKTKKHAEAALWQTVIQKAVRKLKQGLGRGIRSPKDEINVWVCDSRLPIQPSRRNAIIGAIPQRFISNFYRANVFRLGEDGKDAKATGNTKNTAKVYMI